MAIIAWLHNRASEKAQITQLRNDLESKSAGFREEMARQNISRHADAYGERLIKFYSEIEGPLADLAKLENERTLRKARFWELPIPQMPFEAQVQDAHWVWYSGHRTYYLNFDARVRIRREAYQELELRYKPWLSWIALIISVASLIITIFKS